MVLRRQTIWLLTMLSLMVVLSAYYLFSDDPTSVSYTEWDDQERQDSMNEDVDTDITFEFTEDTDFFITQRYEREVERAQLLEEYEKQLTSETTAQSVNETRNRMNEIYELAEAETTIESLLRAEGYEEALVIANPELVNVVVKSDGLEKTQVVKIIKMVQEHLEVPGTNVSVSLHK